MLGMAGSAETFFGGLVAGMAAGADDLEAQPVINMAQANTLSSQFIDVFCCAM
jgi:hypothetical protein